MGKLFKVYLDGGTIYTCSSCQSHLALHDELISTNFRGRTGRAYLFATVSNVNHSAKEDRMLSTGLHTVCDVFCIACHTNVGWYYEEAFEESQKYKEGKYVLEKALLEKDTNGGTGAPPAALEYDAQAISATAQERQRLNLLRGLRVR